MVDARSCTLNFTLEGKKKLKSREHKIFSSRALGSKCSAPASAEHHFTHGKDFSVTECFAGRPMQHLTCHKAARTFLPEEQESSQGSPQQCWVSTGSTPCVSAGHLPQTQGCSRGKGRVRGLCDKTPPILPCPHAKGAPAASGTECPAISLGSPRGHGGRRQHSRRPGTGTPARSGRSRWSAQPASQQAVATVGWEKRHICNAVHPSQLPPQGMGIPVLLLLLPPDLGLHKLLEQSLTLQMSPPTPFPAAATKCTSAPKRIFRRQLWDGNPPPFSAPPKHPGERP